MTLDDFKDLLEGVRGNKARCPAHDDSTASLTLAEGDDGRILVTCWAGCELRDICDSLGIRMSDLFPPTEDIVYTYVDELGRPLYDKIRKPTKEFWFERYVGGSKERGLGEVQKVLYRLDELVQADPGRVVWITEGEKDVEALRAAGAIATTMGGVNDWRPEFAEFFRDRFVKVCMDKDAPGGECASKVMLASSRRRRARTPTTTSPQASRSTTSRSRASSRSSTGSSRTSRRRRSGRASSTSAISCSRPVPRSWARAG